jgi:hypothetical protein
MLRPLGLAAAVMLAAILIPAAPQAAEPAGGFGLISDIHFNPFDPPDLAQQLSAADAEAWPAIFAGIEAQAISSWGSDTNYALLSSSLAAFASSAAETDFAVVPGDFLVHEFEQKAATALGVPATDDKVRDMAVKTTIFVADSLAKALPGRPIVLALGNNDSDCGDYEITPGGGYLAGTREMVRRLAGPALVAPDFDETYGAGGYYAVQHPGLKQTLILVVNDVLWSAKYRDACGAGGEAAAEAMMGWLRDRLAEQRATGGSVWIVHHIPWGIDSFSTVHSKADSCAAQVVPFLRAPYADGFIALLRAYRDIVQASYSGHVHTDDYRLLIDEGGEALGLQKIPPAISPIYENNPGFQIVSYDLATGLPTDFSVRYLANLSEASLAVPGDWRHEYSFTEAYGVPQYSAEGVAAMAKAVAAGGDAADKYRRFYTVSHDPLSAEDLPAYLCAIDHLDQASFTACYCGG